MATIPLTIVTPERTVLDETVQQVTIPTTEGEITVLPHHVNLISAISKGDIVVTATDGELVPFAVVGGFVKIEDNTVAILADFAEHVDEITEEKITAATKRAETLRAQAGDDATARETFEELLEHSVTRAHIATKWKTKKYRRLPSIRG